MLAAPPPPCRSIPVAAHAPDSGRLPTLPTTRPPPNAQILPHRLASTTLSYPSRLEPLRPAPRSGTGPEVPVSPPEPPTAASPVAEPVLTPTDVPSDSGSTSPAVDEPSDSDSDSDDSTGSDSPAPRPRKTQRRGRQVLQPAQTPPSAAVDFLPPRRVPLKSSQPTPPRRLTLSGLLPLTTALRLRPFRCWLLPVFFRLGYSADDLVPPADGIYPLTALFTSERAQRAMRVLPWFSGQI